MLTTAERKAAIYKLLSMFEGNSQVQALSGGAICAAATKSWRDRECEDFAGKYRSLGHVAFVWAVKLPEEAWIAIDVHTNSKSGCLVGHQGFKPTARVDRHASYVELRSIT